MIKFKEMMRPKVLEEIFAQEDQLDDLRKLFLEADLDHSGFLSVDEIYNVMKKIGADVT